VKQKRHTGVSVGDNAAAARRRALMALLVIPYKPATSSDRTAAEFMAIARVALALLSGQVAVGHQRPPMSQEQARGDGLEFPEERALGGFAGQ